MKKLKVRAKQNEPAQKADVSSQSPEAAMQSMMDSIDALRSIYVQETDALLSANTDGFLALQDEKLQAAYAYQSNIDRILARKDEMKNISPLVKKRLEEMQRDFAEISQKNMDALQRMRRTMERLGQTIRTSARDIAQKERAVSYGETGSLKNDETKILSTGISETA